MGIDFNGLKNFIAEARKNTYARDGRPVENPLLVDSKQLEYRKGEFFYRDIYFGGENNFAGQEIIYQNDKSIWSMVYCGSAEPPEVTDFLKKSLLDLSEKCRFGGKCEFKENDLKYKDEGEGTLERFSGGEEIFSKGESVYKLKYQGGLILK